MMSCSSDVHLMTDKISARIHWSHKRCAENLIAQIYSYGSKTMPLWLPVGSTYKSLPLSSLYKRKAIKVWIEKEIDLLNLSFDDIESCIAELQKIPPKTRSVSMNSLHGNISISSKREKKRLPLLSRSPKKGKKKESGEHMRF
ncbi:unnamed protein product [Protopolystoma xenopodis]|uniref:Uncharacterized protein n=1 Tax=Protopolystoma xenopodis TaxID=117903 RepID=A0A448WDW2_9PLAT|nr:unnamed protein product [Protopolystoma xenopodis]